MISIAVQNTDVLDQELKAIYTYISVLRKVIMYKEQKTSTSENNLQVRIYRLQS